MAVLALAVAGSAMGAAIGGTFLGVSAASWGWMAGSMLGNALFAPDVEGPRLNDLRVTGTEYGATIPWVAGSPRISGQIVWASPKRETATTQSAKGGPESTTYTYDCDLLILLTENEIAGVSRVWVNSELVWGNGTTKSGVWGNMTVYTGTADQLPDPVYEAAVGVGNAPAYRGRGYVVIQGLQLGGSGQIPNLSFEVGTYFAEPDADVVLLMLFDEMTEPTGIVKDLSIYDHDVYVGSAGSVVNGNLYTASSAMSGQVKCKAISSVEYGNLMDFTIEGFALIPNGYDVVKTRTLFSLSDNASDSGGVILSVGMTSNTNPDFNFVASFLQGDSGGGGVSGFLDGIVYNEELHFCFMRSGENQRFYINGLLVYTFPSIDATRPYNAVTVWPGSRPGVVDKDDYYVSEIRMTRRAIYDIDGFSVPVSPLSNLKHVEFVYGNQNTASLDSVYEVLMRRAGYIVNDFDVNQLLSFEKPLRGMALGQVTATRGPLESLQMAWFFEASKSDKIYIRPRSTTSVATIPFADLGAADDAVSDVEPLALNIGNELEIPAQVALSYPSMEQDYQAATEMSDRLLSGQESTRDISLGIGMTAAEAKGVADALVFDQVAALTKTTLRVPLKYAYVEPGDIVTAINADGRSYRLRVQVKRDTLSIIELECVLDDVGALESAAVTDGSYITVAEPVTVESTTFEALDIPLLRDADNTPGYYVAAAPVITNPTNYEWRGALVARSWNDTDYAELFQARSAAVMGTCSNTLGNWTGGNVYDETNALAVVTTGGQLSSATRDNLQLDGALNVAAVGSQAAGWELIRFRNATLTGPNTYVLTGLHRGFRGTEWAMAGHGAGEQFVLLTAALGRVTDQTSQLNLPCHIKAVTFGLRLADVTSEPFVDTGVVLRPFSPVNARALASGSDLLVTWQRRTRVSYAYAGANPAVPLGEAAELYRVRLFAGATLVRTAYTSSPAYTYAAAELAADGFASGATVSIEICQVSDIVGPGYPATLTGLAP